MRIILYTGKGGVGKTSIAAATAIRSAKEGLKTLIVSTDPAHSLGDSLDLELSSEPVEVMENLWAQEIDTIHEVEQGWGQIQKYITTLFTSKAIQDITVEELTVFPGLEELLCLLRILRYYKQKTYDVLIIDCAPTGETLTLLSYPEVLSWWMEKLFPIQRKAVKIMRPVAQPLLGITLPSDNVMGELVRVFEQLQEMREIIGDRETTSIRIVVNPEKMVIKEAKRSFTYLNLYNYNVDAIVVNRVMPDTIVDTHFKMWKEIHKRYKEEIEESFSPLPIYNVPLFEQEVVGIEMLNRLGQTYLPDQPADIKYNTRTHEVTKEGEEYVFALRMPFTDKKDLSLNQKADELIIKAGAMKRSIALPRTLTNLVVKGAKFEDEVLKIRFGS